MANLFKRYESESYPGQFHVVCEDDVEVASRYGWGHTLEEAREAWAEGLLERVDDHIHDLMTSGAISKEEAEEAWTAIDGLAYLPFVEYLNQGWLEGELLQLTEATAGEFIERVGAHIYQDFQLGLVTWEVMETSLESLK